MVAPRFGGACALLVLAAGPWSTAAGKGPAIRMNSVGFPRNGPKLATVVAKHCGKAWQVKAVPRGTPALSGATSPMKNGEGSTISGVCLVDFSALEDEGTYVLSVEEAGTSPAFAVGDDAYDDLFAMSMAAFYLARCGTHVHALPAHTGLVTTSDQGRPFEHGACHLKDGYVDAKHTKEEVSGEVFKDGTGGWHDAGDYGKYSVNTGFSIGVLLFTWEHFEAEISCAQFGVDDAGGLPQFLAEVKWGMAWLLKMQKDDGTVYHKLTPSHFAGFGDLPEDNHPKRYYSPWSTSATATLAAAAAQASRVFAKHDKDFADQCLRQARLAYKALQEHPAEVKPDLSAFGTGTYVMHDNPHWDDGIRLWAAMELYEATGEDGFLADGERRLRSLDAPSSTCGQSPQPADCKVADQVDWDMQRSLGAIRYATSKSKALDEALVLDTKKQLRVSAAPHLTRPPRRAAPSPAPVPRRW